MKKTVTALILVLLTCTFLVARVRGVSWNTETVDSAGDVGDHTSIAVDSGDNPHISYESRSDATLKYAYYDGGWNTETVDTNVDVGGRTSIAVDSGDNLHISYRDDTNDNLKYAYTHAYMPIQATIDIDPNSLNLRSTGQWITAYIELPEGYDVNAIDISTLMLNNTVSVDLDAPSAIGDHDNDGTPDLMVKFSRSEVIDYIKGVLGTPGTFTSLTLTISGELNDGTSFEGSDTIKAIYRHAGGAGKRTFMR